MFEGINGHGEHVDCASLAIKAGNTMKTIEIRQEESTVATNYWPSLYWLPNMPGVPYSALLSWLPKFVICLKKRQNKDSIGF
jgi:hypothetical protein